MSWMLDVQVERAMINAFKIILNTHSLIIRVTLSFERNNKTEEKGNFLLFNLDGNGNNFSL